jgi:hypothetical protein
MLEYYVVDDWDVKRGKIVMKPKIMDQNKNLLRRTS